MGETTVKGCVCNNCKHTWTPRGGVLPLVCPSCGSVRWNMPPRPRSAAYRPARRTVADLAQEGEHHE